ncbi:hypothetical protein [Bailinhaonella thermotolerans]|uniref:Uncharacterized protein n=1 Tax=Bailinhaonella thermotolerans TaxID=1070861 RepID=A0A3A4A5X1_9ACTN|nr:hypothetical protein [Bailinhaonella thermotolerans]RJL23955.1 hypothetical protein D5H75_31455 [Bailinhaonella thermotolerans]
MLHDHKVPAVHPAPGSGTTARPPRCVLLPDAQRRPAVACTPGEEKAARERLRTLELRIQALRADLARIRSLLSELEDRADAL